MKEESLEVVDQSNFKTHHVSFDYYGNYLATGAGQAVSVYTGKLFNEQVARFTKNEGNVNVVKFAPSGNFLASGADDRWLKVYSL
jgi:WD40 repeat protein